MNLSQLEKKWVLLIIPIIGFVAVLKATSFFIGISPDSTFYISAAESLRSQGELRSIYEGSQMEYLSHYPPGYSIILYLINLIFNDIYEAARWCNALFLFGFIYLIGIILRSKLTAPFVLLAQLLILTNSSIFPIFEMAWSETPYLFFSLLAIFSLYKFSENDKSRMKWLLFSAFFITISLSIRYIGVTLILASTIVIWNVLSEEKIAKRIKYIVIHGFLASFSLIIWMLRNIILIDKPTDRHFAFHPMPLEYYQEWFRTTKVFFLQLPTTQFLNITIGALVLIALLVFSIVVWKRQKHSLEAICLQFAWVYIGFLIFSNTFLDFTPMYFRTMSPPYILILLGLIVFVFNKKKEKKNRIWIGLFVLLLVFQSKGFAGRIMADDVGMDLSSRSMMIPETVQIINEIPRGSKIYSNCVDRVYLIGKGKTSDWLESWISTDTTFYYDVLFKNSRPIDDYLINTDQFEFEQVYESDDLLVRKRKN